MRAGAEALTQRQAELAQRAAADPDPAVRARLDTMQPTGGPLMADTGTTLGELDRMLFLRRVPLFGQLEPEDLQRLAMAATERLFEAGDTLMREGEPGSELMVIVDGRVRVVRVDDGVERQLRTYGPGDQIGELAILRDRPRAATVIAETEVRTLVIGGDGLRAILTERPEAAMAMLGTLAERISAQ
jgi:signal-transduction protein with cAMP-binding, CBS, and nucleotidyltransferase domain